MNELENGNALSEFEGLTVRTQYLDAMDCPQTVEGVMISCIHPAHVRVGNKIIRVRDIRVIEILESLPNRPAQ